MATRGLVSSGTPFAPPVNPKARTCKRVESYGVSLPRLEPLRRCRAPVVCQASTEQQEIAEAEKRWESQIKEGKVKNVTCKGAGGLQQDGWTLLDVRPDAEYKKAAIKGAVHVPLFRRDTRVDPASLLKQMSAFGMGGWWLGSTHMEANDTFMAEVQSAVPKDAKVVVGCQKGLRSLAACEQLSKAGYQTLAWINGGFDTAAPGDLQVEGDVDLRLAGVGGVSEMLGMSPQQATQETTEPTGGQQILKVAVVILVLDLLVFGYEQVKYMMGQ